MELQDKRFEQIFVENETEKKILHRYDDLMEDIMPFLRPDDFETISIAIKGMPLDSVLDISVICKMKWTIRRTR